jgi:NAD+ diphosphatase
MTDALPLARSAFDRASEHRSDGEWLDDAWERGTAIVVSPKSATPVDSAGHILMWPAEEAPDGIARRFLGVVDEQPYFAVTAEPDGDDWLTLREIGPTVDDLEAGLLVTAVGLEQWHQRHGFCPNCGSPTLEAEGGWTRVCLREGIDHFPRTDPAVIMLVHDGADRALLGRGNQWGEGRFSTLAGFVEPGESLESAVAREVFEEVGVCVRDVRYVASQPWPFPASLMLGFSALADADTELAVDPGELAEAAWFSREEVQRAADLTDGVGSREVTPWRLRGVSPKLSISRYLVDRWLAGDL